jgi:hypothetical protein
MAAETRGSIYPTRAGYGIRWPENGKRKFRSGFATKKDARRWFNEQRCAAATKRRSLGRDLVRRLLRCISGSPRLHRRQANEGHA